jgi:hypothetical protein
MNISISRNVQIQGSGNPCSQNIRKTETRISWGFQISLISLSFDLKRSDQVRLLNSKIASESSLQFVPVSVFLSLRCSLSSNELIQTTELASQVPESQNIRETAEQSRVDSFLFSPGLTQSRLPLSPTNVDRTDQ